MLSRWKHIWVLLCLLFVIQLAACESFRLVRRQEGDSTRELAPTATGSDLPQPTKGLGPSRTAEPSTQDAKAPKLTDTASVTQTTATTQSIVSSTAITTNGALDNSTFVNVTIPEGQLPIKPEITPGWGCAGVVMLFTGMIYTMIGIRNKEIHTFFSTAYTAALGITILVIYVMTVPVTNAIQGGYVVAVMISGCAFGGASMFFKELTESLGCAIGGFCISMWLLCLVPGGLLQTVTVKAIFIACFTLVGFAFHFSRYTRDWALILLVSFGGATVTVLGIDCFSRAGLKEFWAYIWGLNDNLFPLGADTYPVTKGIRVETAAIVIIFLFGIVSQIKLWRIMREQRERRATENAKGQRDLEQEEANVGREVEEANARERRQWERTYGDGDAGSTTISQQSENGDNVGEKKLKGSQAEPTKITAFTEVIELSDMSEQGLPRAAAESLMATEEDREGKITIRVAADDVPNSAEEADELNEKPTAKASHENARSTSGESKPSKKASQTSMVSQTPAPEVVPLPFKVPEAEEDDVKPFADRSSIATFADEEDVTTAVSKRRSFANRLYQGSATLLRSLSQRSAMTPRGTLLHNGESTEDLFVPRSRGRKSDDGSVAATVDAESLSSLDNKSDVSEDEQQKDIKVDTQLSGKEDDKKSTTENSRAASGADNEPKQANSVKNETAEKEGVEEEEGSVRKGKSSASGVSARASLTKERLPASLSRAVMHYRTNEWAKRLSHAETPELDELHIEHLPRRASRSREKAAPVDVAELQKTAADGIQAPAPAIVRSDSLASNVMTNTIQSRRSSRHSIAANSMIPGGVPQDAQSPNPNNNNNNANTFPNTTPLPRSSSVAARRTSGIIEPIAEEQDAAFANAAIAEETAKIDRPERLNSPPLDQADIASRPSVPGLISYNSPQTLIGQREMFLRNKFQGNLLGNSSADLTQAQGIPRDSSDAGSLSNYNLYAAAVGADVDDLPLSQRKQLMRHSSLATSASNPAVTRMNSVNVVDTYEKAPFNSHQPKRISTLPPHGIREAQLANFRQSVAQDLRSGTPLMGTGRETSFASTTNLLGSRESDVERSIDINRSMLISQKEVEAQRKEMQCRQKEWNDMAFDERMRSGDLLEAHREAMRRMQKHAKDQ